MYLKVQINYININILAWKMTQEACPHWTLGNVRAKRRQRRKKRREKICRLLRSQGLESSSAEDPYRHSWNRERGRNYSSSEEEDGLQVLARAWARHKTPHHSTSTPSPSPLRRHETRPTPSHAQEPARRRTPHHSTPRRRQSPEMQVLRIHDARDGQGLWNLL